jgi:hypothetical protein
MFITASFFPSFAGAIIPRGQEDYTKTVRIGLRLVRTDFKSLGRFVFLFPSRRMCRRPRVEVIAQHAFYAGWPAANTAVAIARRVFEEADRP